MKIQLTQQGYTNFTGFIGVVSFTNGISDNDLTDSMRSGIAAVYSCGDYNGSTHSVVAKKDVTNPAWNPFDTSGDTSTMAAAVGAPDYVQALATATEQAAALAAAKATENVESATSVTSSEAAAIAAADAAGLNNPALHTS